MKDYWFLAFVRCSNECVCVCTICVFENQLGEQNDSTLLGTEKPTKPSSPPTSDLPPPQLIFCTRPCFLFFVISPQSVLLFSRMAFL